MQHFCDTLESLVHLRLTLECERLGDNADRELAQLLGDIRNHWSRAGSGARRPFRLR